ncbi:hypothetical protein [Hydrotalea sandarakina]|jgi:hypothetical protein|nr:hypothetical protein [Hydrotalea sandarakina]
MVTSGCKKDFHSSSLISVNAKDSIHTYPLGNWENLDFMPTPSGIQILSPWASGAVRGFSSDILYDIKQSDGWVLVYNTFNTNILQHNPWFALYNQYRGLLRIYMFVDDVNSLPSTYLTSGLNLGPNANNSSMLNFIGQDLIDVSQNNTTVTKIEPTQIAINTWYASQFEIAYDPNITNTSTDQINLNWFFQWTNISTFQFSGDQYGTINGIISTPSQPSNLFSNLLKGTFEATGIQAIDKYKNIPTSIGLSAKAVSAVETGLTSGLSGVVNNVFNAIFGGSSSNTQEVNLSINTQIQLRGTSSENGGIIPYPGLGFFIPGTTLGNMAIDGYMPAYRLPMGIFNIAAKPTVHLVKNTYSTGTPQTIDNTFTNFNFKIDDNSFNKIFNPLVSSYVTNYNESIVLINPIPIIPYIDSTQLETIGNITALQTNYLSVPSFVGARYSPTAAIRISFNVKFPGCSGNGPLIVKTFLANVVNN